MFHPPLSPTRARQFATLIHAHGHCVHGRGQAAQDSTATSHLDMVNAPETMRGSAPRSQRVPPLLPNLLLSRPQRITYEKEHGKAIATTHSTRPVPFFLNECSNSTFDFRPTRAAQILLQGCQDLREVKFSTVIGSVDLVRCTDIRIFTNGGRRTIVLDMCKDVLIELHDPVGCVVYTSSCQHVTIKTTFGLSYEIREVETTGRMKTIWRDDHFVTEQSDLYGDIPTITAL